MRQPRLGDITDEAARALDSIAAIEAVKEVPPEFWPGAFRQLILDLDAVGAFREVVRAGDFLAAAYGRLEDKPADVREVSTHLWTSGPSLVELDAYGTDPREEVT